MFPHKGAGSDPGELLDLRMDHPGHQCGSSSRVAALARMDPKPLGQSWHWLSMAFGVGYGVEIQRGSCTSDRLRLLRARQSHAALLQVLLLTYVNASRINVV